MLIDIATQEHTSGMGGNDAETRQEKLQAISSEYEKLAEHYARSENMPKKIEDWRILIDKFAELLTQELVISFPGVISIEDTDILELVKKALVDAQLPFLEFLHEDPFLVISTQKYKDAVTKPHDIAYTTFLAVRDKLRLKGDIKNVNFSEVFDVTLAMLLEIDPEAFAGTVGVSEAEMAARFAPGTELYELIAREEGGVVPEFVQDYIDELVRDLGKFEESDEVVVDPNTVKLSLFIAHELWLSSQYFRAIFEQHKKPGSMNRISARDSKDCACNPFEKMLSDKLRLLRKQVPAVDATTTVLYLTFVSYKDYWEINVGNQNTEKAELVKSINDVIQRCVELSKFEHYSESNLKDYLVKSINVLLAKSKLEQEDKAKLLKTLKIEAVKLIEEMGSMGKNSPNSDLDIRKKKLVSMLDGMDSISLAPAA